MKIITTALSLATMTLAGCGGSSGSGQAPASLPPPPPPVNNAPTIDAIGNKSVSANVTSAIGFTVGDEDTTMLTLALTSSDSSILPLAGLATSGAGTARTLSVTPTPDTVGRAFVTIDVTDSAGLTASTSFEISVDQQNVSLKTFTRDLFAADASAEPALINAIDFSQDAEDDDFADLLTP